MCDDYNKFFIFMREITRGIQPMTVMFHPVIYQLLLFDVLFT